WPGRTGRCSRRGRHDGFPGRAVLTAGPAAELGRSALLLAVIETNGSEVLMPVPQSDLTASFAAPPESPLANLPGRPLPNLMFDEDLRRLLRSRLLLAHLLALAFFILIAAINVSGRALVEDPTLRQRGDWMLAVPLAECLVGAVVLWRSPGMSQWSLR